MGFLRDNLGLMLVLLTACGGAPTGSVSSPADTAVTDSFADLPSDAFSDTISNAETMADLVADLPPADSLAPVDSDQDIAGTDDIAPDAEIDLSSDISSTCACGDTVCDTACGENVKTCPFDCKGCGDGICQPGEGPKVCPEDCCGGCGDHKCTGYDCGESPETCPQDCGNACGDKICEKGESPQTCALDCAWQACGNGVCEASDGGPAKCPQDCGTACGDGICSKGEDFIGCPIDCGYCGDGICSVKIGETSATCVADCKGGECDPSLPSDVTKCDDGNPCTLETCPPSGTCHHPPMPGPCDDGNICTTGDHCVFGACQLAALLDCDDQNPCTADLCDAKLGCQHPFIGGACSDGDACTLGDVCKSGSCASGVPLTCDDGNACTSDSCDPASGCTATSNDENTCTDGNLCTTGDHCAAGVCAGASDLGCDDGNPCTADLCAPDSGCAHLPNSATCSDGNACTFGDSCVNAVCTPGNATSCNDDNPCTADGCSPGSGCTHKPTSAACDDGNACTVADTCKSGNCQGGAPLDCDDGNVCTKDSCNISSGCTSTNDDGAVCSDGDVCTSGDACLGGNCVSGSGLACDDGNPCTLDGCNAGAGCTHKAISGPCEDGNPCTTGDACFNAVCLPGPGQDCSDGNPCTTDACDTQGGCAHTPSTGACTDGNACTIGDLCKTGACQPGSAFDCSDGNPCTDDGCSASTGCVHLASTATCEDGNVCTTGDTCANSVCTPGSQIGCDDAQPCTIDSCDAALGCQHKPSIGPCNDGDLCTTGDSCAGGTCAGAGTLACDDNNPCTLNKCNAASGCFFPPDGTASCSDGNACTVGDHCSGGTCLYATTLGCDDGLPCTVDSCDTSAGCKHVAAANGAVCDDGNLCTTGDSCQAGSCTASGALNCDDGNACTTGTCTPTSGCAQLANTATCTDGNGCTAGDHCTGGQCVPTALVSCDDGNPCTADSCNPGDGSCTHNGAILNGAGCSDGNLCTPSDACLAGVCVGSGALNCDDSNPCTDDSCVSASGCAHTPNSAPCSDGNACTTGDHCGGGSCLYGAVVNCNDGNPCTNDSCNLATGACAYTADASLNGTVCSDGSVCTTTDTCQNGACHGGAALSCDDANPCTDDPCNATTGCSHTANSAPTCDDGNLCTVGDHCSGGTCLGVLKNCDDNAACTADSCNGTSGACVHNPLTFNGIPCSDGNACTMGDSCSGGACQPGTVPANCDDNNTCTADSCLPATGCRNVISVGAGCDDGDACTGLGACTADGGCAKGSPKDADNDGYVDKACGGNDCDDNQASIHPGATEICDNIDQNCDGTVDEGCDKDNDDYCNSAMAINLNVAVVTCLHGGGDCNDLDPLVNPGATEQIEAVRNGPWSFTSGASPQTALPATASGRAWAVWHTTDASNSNRSNSVVGTLGPSDTNWNSFLPPTTGDELLRAIAVKPNGSTVHVFGDAPTAGKFRHWSSTVSGANADVLANWSSEDAGSSLMGAGAVAAAGADDALHVFTLYGQYMRRPPGGSWSTVSVDLGGLEFYPGDSAAAITTASDNTVHAVGVGLWAYPPQYQVRYFHDTVAAPGVLTSDVIDTVSATNCAIAWSAHDGRLHIFYQGPTGLVHKYKLQSASSWSSETIGTSACSLPNGPQVDATSGTVVLYGAPGCAGSSNTYLTTQAQIPIAGALLPAAFGSSASWTGTRLAARPEVLPVDSPVTYRAFARETASAGGTLAVETGGFDFGVVGCCFDWIFPGQQIYGVLSPAIIRTTWLGDALGQVVTPNDGLYMSGAQPVLDMANSATGEGAFAIFGGSSAQGTIGYWPHADSGAMLTSPNAIMAYPASMQPTFFAPFVVALRDGRFATVTQISAPPTSNVNIYTWDMTTWTTFINGGGGWPNSETKALATGFTTAVTGCATLTPDSGSFDQFECGSTGLRYAIVGNGNDYDTPIAPAILSSADCTRVWARHDAGTGANHLFAVLGGKLTYFYDSAGAGVAWSTPSLVVQNTVTASSITVSPSLRGSPLVTVDSTLYDHRDGTWAIASLLLSTWFTTTPSDVWQLGAYDDGAQRWGIWGMNVMYSGSRVANPIDIKALGLGDDEWFSLTPYNTIDQNCNGL